MIFSKINKKAIKSKHHHLVAILSIASLLATSEISFANNRQERLQTQRVIEVNGLQEQAQILIDTWGVPHIYAKNEKDLFFAQGFNVARDRLFQIDLWRRRGLGQLAEVFGSAYLEQDRAARLFLYRGDMKAEWQSYGSKAENITLQFVAGINAYIDYLKKHPRALPPEFQLLKYAPAKWSAEDVVRIRSHGLTRNLTSEVNRAKFACSGDFRLDEVRQRLSPQWETKIPEGLDPCLPDQVLRQFTLATQNVQFDPAMLRITQARSDSLQKLTVDSGQSDIQQNPQERMEGSNNWVIAPEKSGTGRAILANDPHRAYSAPSLRYITHLSTPGLDVIGAGEPALPGISIGHNGTIAFGLTIMSIDQEDLYVYEINPENPNQYRYQGQWENMQKQREIFLVRDNRPLVSDLFFTRHGPIIYVEKEKHRAYAVRTGWLEAGMAPYFGSVDYMRAKNFAQFKQAMLHWGAPTENQVYADTSGNIGWVPGGLTPIRPNWDGLMPVPGDGRYEWAGFLSGDKLPFSYNPPSAWFASANEMNLPLDYPYQERKLGFEWPHNARYQRIADVLSQDKKITLDDSMRLQNDFLSLPAKRLIAILKQIQTSDEVAQKAINYLSNWDYQETADSGQAALYQVWLSQTLSPAYKDLMLGTQSNLVSSLPDLTLLLKNLETTESFPPQFGERPLAMRDQLLASSLAAAYVKLIELQGEDTNQWRWGDIQKTLFAHPMTKLFDSAKRANFNVGPFSRGGSAHTVSQSSYDLHSFIHLNGPSFRVVMDVGDWDQSRAVNTPGQSGDPQNPHYRDLAPMWAVGDYFPLLYTHKAVKAATKEKILLQPAK